ncbi:hypothetical protein CR513_18805, partial [Mucuna pruriens]
MDDVKLSRLELFEIEIVRLCSVCPHSAETKSDRSLPRSSRLSFCQERLSHYRDKSSTDPLYAFDPVIELTLRRLRRTRNLILCIDNSVASSNIFVEPGQMENNDRTLKELATPDVSGLIHLLPKFHGLARGDPHKHLKEFHVVCSTMRP